MAYRFRARDLKVQRSESGTHTFFVIEDAASGVRHRLYEMEYEVAQLLDGKRPPAKIAELVNQKLGLSLEGQDVDSFTKQLVALGFVEET